MRAVSRSCCSRSLGARNFVSGRASVAASRLGRSGRRLRSRILSAKAEAAAEAAEISDLLDPMAPAVLGANEILSILPHRCTTAITGWELRRCRRYPFLLVDRVTHVRPKEMIVGVKNVTINDNFFPGHFPNRPIMPGAVLFCAQVVDVHLDGDPGVLQVEALAQLAGILMLRDLDDSAKENFFFGGIDNCRFKRPVVPGDALVRTKKLQAISEPCWDA